MAQLLSNIEVLEILKVLEVLEVLEVLKLDELFDLELNNLPTLIKKIIFNKMSDYNKELNCLPKFVELN